MNEPQIELVESKGLTINLPVIGAPMAVRAEGDEVVILMRLTLRPRDNVVNINLDISASGNCTPMPGLYEDATADVSRNWRAIVHEGSAADAPNEKKVSDGRSVAQRLRKQPM